MIPTLALAAALAPVRGSADPTPALPAAREAVLGEGGGVVRLDSGVDVVLLPGSARKDGGTHRVVVEPVPTRMPASEAVGPRPIDRRAATPLGPVEGPPVAVGPALRLRVEAVTDEPGGTGAVDEAALAARKAAVPEGLMPYWEPAREVAREGILIVVPGAAPKGKERLSAWLWSSGGMRRTKKDARGRGRGEPVVWDPCLKLGRIDAEGAAWFYLDDWTCGLDEHPTWTPLREQTQDEFSAWVLERTAEDQLRAVRKELRDMARAETKAEQDD